MRFPTVCLVIVLALSSVVSAQTVVKVTNGNTIQLSDGQLVHLSGVSPSASQQQKARIALQYYVLDRPITLENKITGEWGDVTAIVKWRGLDINVAMVRRGFGVVPAMQYVAPPVQYQPPAVQYYVPPAATRRYFQSSSYQPSFGNYCVGNT